MRDSSGAAPALKEVLVTDVMLREPKTISSEISVSEALSALADEHVHMLLLIDGAYLVGTLVRADLPLSRSVSDERALRYATVQGRVVEAGATAQDVSVRMKVSGLRRLAVTDADGRLLGLVCLKRHGRGFCSCEDVASRIMTIDNTDTIK